MAYYSPVFDQGDSGEYNSTTYSNSYYVVPFQSSNSLSGFEFHESDLEEYYRTTDDDDDAYDPSISRSGIHYSNYYISEPKVLEYDPPTYDVVPFQATTMHSNFESDEPKLKEYYPSYGVAYDPFPTQFEANSYEPRAIGYEPSPHGSGYDIDPYQASITHSDFHEPRAIGYEPSPYGSGYDIVPYQASITHSEFEFHEPKSEDYYSTTNHDAYDPSVTRSDISYSTYYPSVPKIFEYDPTPCAIDFEFREPELIDYHPTSYGDGYALSATRSEISYSSYYSSEPKVIEYDPSPYESISSRTQFFISYSTSEPTELDYEEYDPTPYGGGYDPTITYGKPLPPSDEICYPRSAPEPNGHSLDGFSYASTPSPYGQNGGDDTPEKPRSESKLPDISEGEKQSEKPRSESKLPDVSEGEKQSEKPRSESKLTDVSEGEKQANGTGDGLIENGNGREDDLVEPVDSSEGEEREGYTYDYDYPWSDYDYGYGNGRRGGCDDYSPDTIDLCESLFGYWPCLSKKHQKYNGNQEGAEVSNFNPWNGITDYLFGGPFAYGYGDPSDGRRY